MDTVKLHSPAEINADKPGLSRLSERTAASWPEAFEKMDALILAELRKPDCDFRFWSDELESLRLAGALHCEMIDDIDREIKVLRSVRTEALSRMAGMIRPSPSNVAHFLLADNPAGYLSW